MDDVFDFIFSASALSTLLFWLFADSIWKAYLSIFHPKSLASEKKVYTLNIATEIGRTTILLIAIIVTIIAYFLQK